MVGVVNGRVWDKATTQLSFVLGASNVVVWDLAEQLDSHILNCEGEHAKTDALVRLHTSLERCRFHEIMRN